jgi:DNA-binding transcriptional ArsR family regulator
MGEYSQRELDQIFFALSHRTRRRLLDQLAESRESRVTDLAARHRLSLNTVSKHLAVLERARLVRRRVSGRVHFIRLEPSRVDQAEAWLRYHREFWAQKLDNLAALFGQDTKDAR